MLRAMPQSAPAAPHLLTIEDLCVWRGDRCLIDGLSFAVGGGELVWLRGDNGVGKTSLLRVLCGLAHAERGRIAWRGLDTSEHPVELRAELLYVGHLDALKRALTARENLSADAALRGGSDPASLDAALTELGVADVADLPVAQLSAGQRRRVALARLASSRAPLWLLDEPTTNLDGDGQGVVARLIERHLARAGLVVVASHLPLALAAATQAAVRTLDLAPSPRAAA